MGGWRWMVEQAVSRGQNVLFFELEKAIDEAQWLPGAASARPGRVALEPTFSWSWSSRSRGVAAISSVLDPRRDGIS